jgi:hypothetical protein
LVLFCEAVPVMMRLFTDDRVANFTSTPRLVPAVPPPPRPVTVRFVPADSVARLAAPVAVPSTRTPVLLLPVDTAAVAPAVPFTLSAPPAVMRAWAPSTFTP